MEKTYDPSQIEKRWAAYWEQRGHYRAGGDGDPYCIMLPPPNVTGTLHMGHAFNNTIMDALTRYHRMRGHDTLWQPGMDHAGIATQMVVERQLSQEGQSRHDLGRDAFVERVWKWKEQSGGTIANQLRRLGSSLDWSRDRFTMDAELSRAVTEVFARLHEEGLIYRGKRLVNWDPVLHTAISDLEVISEEESGSLWHLRYPLIDGSDHLVVATTRPETMLGDAAVAVNPSDERYRHLVGKQVALPLTGRTISIIADDYVDPEFGSGCVKITPAHDFNDYAVGQRHGLLLTNIFTVDAALHSPSSFRHTNEIWNVYREQSESSEDAWNRLVGMLHQYSSDSANLLEHFIPKQYQGMDRFKARKQIVVDLKAQGLIEKIEPHKLKVPRGDRSNAVVEPYLTDQWYVKIEPLAQEAVRVVEDGHLRFVPDNWSKTYFEWMRNIQDWCISRQLWWGHRIPAWYDEAGNIYVGRSEDEARGRYKLAASVSLKQDEDVLDTWFSSALWPFSTLGWPEKTPALKTYYPSSVLVTGFDIIFFWVARMIMMGCRFMGEVPFREVYIHGLVRDAEGQKMSKSKGNILDPIDLIDGIGLESLIAKRTAGLMRPQDAAKIEKATRKEFPEGIAAYGTDALRFTFAALATQGRDIRFDVKRFEGYRNFCNKLWNASRYVLLSLEGQEASLRHPAAEPGLAERWIRSRLQQTIATVAENFAGYRFDLAAQALYEFVWDEFCDWYLELSKVTLNDVSASEAAKAGTRQTLVQTLEALLRLAHPIMPFITEEIWQRVAPLAGVQGETIMRQPFPLVDAGQVDRTAAREIEWVKSFILGVRRIRSEMNISPSKALHVLVQGGSTDELFWLREGRASITALARIGQIEQVAIGAAPEAATALAGETTILIPLADLIDPEEEIKRLSRELDGRRGELTRAQAKLANENYVSRAPAEVVARERARAGELANAIGKLEEQLARVTALRRS